jgi:hypothetical protein
MSEGSISSNLVDELTKFALYKYNEWYVMRRDGYHDAEDKDEYIYGIFLKTLENPLALPLKCIEDFLSKVKFSRLMEADEEGIRNMVCGAGKLTPRFAPKGGWKNFSEFHVELVKKAKESGGLINYVKKFNDAESLYQELLKLPEVGEVIGLQLVRELKMVGVANVSLEKLGLPPSDPVRRVLERTGLVAKGSPWNTINEVLKKTFKIPPLVLDVGLWIIGFYYCREKPEHEACPITIVCPKLSAGNS